MTLEDFFTLTEMKNGLSTLARVEELISRMQQQKDCVMTNVGDAVRQWSTVASTLAATESKDCLNDFVKLNGLNFLNQWLQEALKYSNDIADSTVEELIHALLGSLEKLPVDREQSITSGVNMTIEKLLGFKGVVKERARVLSERWKHAGKDDVIFQETVSGGACGDAKPKCSADGEAVDSSNSTCLDFDNTNCRGRTREGNCGTEPVGIETHNSNVMVSHEAAGLDDTNDVHSAAEQTMPSTSSITADANANLGDTNMLASSCLSNSYQEHICRTNESSVYLAAEVSSRDECDASMLKEDGAAREMNMEVDMKEGSPKSGQRDICTVLPSPSFSAASPIQKPERSISCKFDFKGNNYHASKTLETLPRSGSVDRVAPNFLKTMDIKSVVQELHDNDSELKKEDTIETSFHTKEVVESDSEAEELGSESDLIVNKVEALSPRDFSKMGMIDQTSELGFQDGELDALEIARQVAIEVEREVVDYREPFCSSSPEGSSGEVAVEKCKQDEPVKEEVNRSVELLGKSLSGGPSSPNEDNLKSSETDFDPDTCKHETRKQTIDAYESIIKSHRDRCDFDLNEDLGNEEDTYSLNLVLDSSVSVSAPIAVSASKRAPLLPVAPICFEGEQGWKGSAATSAFRPASPRKTEAVKTCAGQKRKSNLIEIDLNVADSGDDDDVTPVSHGFHSLDESMEISSRRADRLKLDLNRLGDDDAAPDQLSYWRPPLRNSEQTMSPASSSSSRQPSMRDFDLNDNPSFFDAFASHNHKKSSARAVGMYESSNLDVPAITIMGSRLAVERKHFLNDTRQSFMVAGHSMEPTSVVSSRPMLPYDTRQSFMVAGQSMEPTSVMSSRPMLPYDTRQSFMVAGQSMEPTSVMSSRPMLPYDTRQSFMVAGQSMEPTSVMSSRPMLPYDTRHAFMVAGHSMEPTSVMSSSPMLPYGTRQSFMVAGQSMEPTPVMSSRPMLPYAQVPLSTCGYDGPVMGPPMPFAPSVYGPGSFPYIIDSRGTTAVPQIIGGAGVHGAPSATPSFLMSVPNAPSQSFLDLNSGLSTKDAGNMDVGTLKHVFMQGHNGLMEKRLH